MTYSIVAREPRTGQLGVAVQSHWFSVGAIVPWARPGVGAVATQANAQVSYGPLALDLLAEGLDAREALERLLTADPQAASRQVAVVDSGGTVAVHTGSSAIPFAGHITGEQFACQANMMSSERVWPRMAEAFTDTSGFLAERLLAALQAGEVAGGDVRGRQSSAMLVVPADGERWRSEVSLRVEDHPDPLAELGRLLHLHAAYRLAGRADELVAEGHHRQAADLYRRASELEPSNHELRFWAGLSAAQAGDLEGGASQVAAAIAQHPEWSDLLARLPMEVAPSARLVVARLADAQ